MDFFDTTQVDHTPVLLTDRAGTGAFEFMFDGRVYVKPEGKTQWSLPAYVAGWLLKHDRDKVWTTDGEYTHRFGMAEPTDDLISGLDPTVIITDPITINDAVVERWNLDGAEPRGAGTQVRTLSGNDRRAALMAQRDRLGSVAARPAFAP